MSSSFVSTAHAWRWLHESVEYGVYTNGQYLILSYLELIIPFITRRFFIQKLRNTFFVCNKRQEMK
jgi:hypothetical protein